MSNPYNLSTEEIVRLWEILLDPTSPLEPLDIMLMAKISRGIIIEFPSSTQAPTKL